MKYPRVLVISSCTGAKASKPSNQLTLADFRQGPEHVRKRERELHAHRTSARRLYTGAQHLEIVEAFHHHIEPTLKTDPNCSSFDLKIISAGYGLIDQYDWIAPYETTFNDLGSAEAEEWAATLRIHEDLDRAIAGYDLVFFLLGENYLSAAGLPLQTRPDQSLVFLVSGASAERIPEHAARTAVLALSNEEAQHHDFGKPGNHFGYGLVGLKGHLFRRLARIVSERPGVLHDWHADPQRAIEALIETARERRNPTLFPEESIASPAVSPPAADSGRFVRGVHTARLDFNPARLSAAEFYPAPPAWPEALPVPATRFTVVINNRDKLKIGPVGGQREDRRIWHFLERAPRGFLTSLAYHSPNGDALPATDEGNIYDCGAWSYKNEPYPILRKADGPLTAERAMEMFVASGARPAKDIIVSPDMMILDGDADETVDRKIRISLDTAQSFLPLAAGYRAMAVTHGSFEQRHRMMYAYLAAGYRHIALGSLAIKSSRDPGFVYRCVEDAVKLQKEFERDHPGEHLYIHVLGVSSISWAASLTRLGVDSFDGSSMYMTAFTGGTFMRYTPDSPALLEKIRIVDNAPWSDALPPCDCPACLAMREEGWDTRAQGGKPGDPSGRPYNGGNEANMGRAVHNINMYLRALQDVQARVLSGDESLLVKRERALKAQRKLQQDGAAEDPPMLLSLN